MGPKIPLHGGITQVGARIAFLAMDKIHELIGIRNEEHWHVIADDIPVAFFGVELNREAADVAFGIGGTFFTGDRREPYKAVGLFADLEHLRLGVWGDVTGDGQFAVSAGAFGMDHPLGNPLAVEVGVLFKQLPVLGQERAPGSGGDRILIIANGASRSGR